MLNLLKEECLIGGSWEVGDTSRFIEVTNPATGKILGKVPDIGADGTKRAVDAAHRALSPWRSLTAKERSHILKNWHSLIIENLDQLATILTQEQGKPLIESRQEIFYAASFIEWFAEEGKRVYGHTIPSPWAGKRIIVTKEAIGVTAIITPWNFPSAMFARKAGAALAAGCTIVAKPSEETPFSTLALAYLAEKACGLDGVINVVTGHAEEIGNEILRNPLIRKLSFTGSTNVGKKLMAGCADQIKKISLELGGNAAFIILDDADVDKAVADLMIAKFRNSGQTCVCPNRVLVHEKIYDVFLGRFTEEVSKLKLGNGLDDSITQGPLINHKAIEKVECLLKDAIAKGAVVKLGGNKLSGLFFEPTIVTNVTGEMLLMQQEIFGPVASIMKFKDDDEAIAIANNTEYGLASYIASGNQERATNMAEKLECGMVAINSGILSTEVAPFGGIKQSGIGREGSFLGIEEYLEIKYIVV